MDKRNAARLFREFFRFKAGFAGLATAAAIIASVATACGFLGRLWWRFDQLSHFRVQYFLGLGFASLLLAMLRRPRTALVFAGFCLLNLTLILPLFFGKTTPLPGAPSLRAILINVNMANKRYRAVKEFILKTQPDIVVFEETSSMWLKQLEDLRDAYPYAVTRPREDCFGIAMFSKHPFLNSGIVHIGTAGVPSVFAELTVNDRTLFILGTHPLPPASAANTRQRNRQLAEIPKFLEDIQHPVILLGDLNASPWSPYFTKLLRETGLKNSARGWGIQATWPSHLLPLRIPIDHCLVSPGIAVTGRDTGPDIGSDHYPLIVDISY